MNIGRCLSLFFLLLPCPTERWRLIFCRREAFANAPYVRVQVNTKAQQIILWLVEVSPHTVYCILHTVYRVVSAKRWYSIHTVHTQYDSGVCRSVAAGGRFGAAVRLVASEFLRRRSSCAVEKSTTTYSQNNQEEDLN